MAALAKSLIGGFLPVQAEGLVEANKICVFVDPVGEGGAFVVGPPAADTNAWAGVADVDILDEASGEIAIDGIVNLIINDTVAAGEELMIDMTALHIGEVIPATTGKQVVAIACQAGVATDTIAARLCRYIKP